MTIYEELGIRPIVNANATLTKLGGSLMPPEVVEAMVEASRQFVDLHELQRRVGEELANLTRNEAAYVCCGAAAGLTLTTAACITVENAASMAHLPVLIDLKNEVIIHKAHRNGYDHAVRAVGIRVVEIGDSTGTTEEQLESAISDKTAAIVWFQGAMTGTGDLPIERVIAVAKTHGVPVIVDAAAQLPPVSNLWRFTELGADLAIFSGGKDLCGPQSSGLIVGRGDLIEACRLNGSPNHSIGRPMKVGKEEMAGLLAAVRRYVALDHEARAQCCEEMVAAWCEALNRLPGVTARRDFPNEAGQPIPRCFVTLESARARLVRDELVSQLLSGNPSVSVAAGGTEGIYLNPMTLAPGEDSIVENRLRELLT
jgi:L-seryl-tRNA(Ser) seleniumtransferase